MSKVLSSLKNIIGKNNCISGKAIIYNNVTIGNNNKIYNDVVIYPNTVIGDNNIIFNNNIIGEYPVQSNKNYRDYDFNKTYGTTIGNNNFFHIRNIIFAGIKRPTVINNDNTILSQVHIAHDAKIHDNVTLYPGAALSGFSECMDHSNIGAYGVIQQHRIVGKYSMVGGSQLVAKNVFPYFVYVNGKITRLNHIKLSDDILANEIELKKIAQEYYNGNRDLNLNELPTNIKSEIELFLSTTK
jgi:UDP-N-acetylglucosamine acyltransferase